MNILVIGGTGFLGSRTAAALRRIPGAKVAVGSRGEGDGHVAIDILDYSSRTRMEGFDFVVNCSDSTAAPPERAAEYCLHRGITFVEPSADPAVVARVRDESLEVEDPEGAVILGAGLFPGLSNLLAAQLLAAHPSTKRLEVGVRYSPWSQAGPGVCNLMAQLVGEPTQRYEQGAMVSEPPLTIGGDFPFWRGDSPTFGVGLAENAMLHWSTGVESTGCVLATVPATPVPVQRVLTLFAPWSLLRLAAVRWLMRAALRVLRGGVFGWRAVGFEIAAVADRTDDGAAAAACLRVRDGFEATAGAIAATVALLAEKKERATGLQLIDQVVSLEDVVERMKVLAAGDLDVEWRSV